MVGRCGPGRATSSHWRATSALPGIADASGQYFDPMRYGSGRQARLLWEAMDSETRAAITALGDRMDRSFELQQLQFVEWPDEVRGEFAQLRGEIAELSGRVDRLEQQHLD